jgi:hypothetical protein
MNYKHTNLQIDLEELKTIDDVKNGNIEEFNKKKILIGFIPRCQ